ncbi:MAG: AAA family ATPase, partial [Nanoarchaeota archaeon]|nr:AAA family ATPase [Nanoarchaeota archaeon]
MPWIKKYRPKKCSEIESQNEAVAKIKEFILNYKKAKKKAMIIHGPTGCGKTCSIYAIANDLDYEILEINASDLRNKEAINTVVGSASKQMSLFSKGKIILVDEIDGVAGREDYGGIAALAGVLQDSSHPIIMTCNDPYGKNLSSIRSKSIVVEFNTLTSNSIFNVLKCMAQKENLSYDDLALKSLASRSGGDMRAAINDLQTLSSEKKLTMEFVDEISEREKKESIINAITKIMKTTDPKLAVASFDNVQEDLNE